MNNPEAEISRCHLSYIKLTGLELPLKSVCDCRIRAWADWLRAGHGVHDLEIVVLWLKKQIRIGERNLGCLRFRNLIEDVNAFQDELAYAKAEQRNAKPVPTDKEKVVQAFRPTTGKEPCPGTVKPSKELIEAFFADMRRKAL